MSAARGELAHLRNRNLRCADSLREVLLDRRAVLLLVELEDLRYIRKLGQLEQRGYRERKRPTFMRELWPSELRMFLASVPAVRMSNISC